MRRLIATSLAAALLSVSTVAAQDIGSPTVIDTILIERHNVFTQDKADSNWGFRLMNSLHATTRERIIRRDRHDPSRRALGGPSPDAGQLEHEAEVLVQLRVGRHGDRGHRPSGIESPRDGEPGVLRVPQGSGPGRNRGQRGLPSRVRVAG